MKVQTLQTIAGPISPTSCLSSTIEIILKPIVSKISTYIKDDWDFLRQLPSNVPFECELFSCDITSLYTSIPKKFGIEAIQYWIEQERNMIPSHFTNNFILDNLKFILTNIINYLVEQWEQSVLHHLHV